MAALGVLGAWAITGLPGALDAWRNAAQTPSADGLSYAELRAELPEGPLNTLLAATGDVCPALPPTIIVGDDVASWLLGNYLLYPRRLDVIQSVDGFTVADIDSHVGGCLLSYGPERERLRPFVERLAQVTCVQNDCLYRILNASAARVQ